MIAVLCGILGGLVYRWRGSPYSKRPMAHLVFALPFGLILLPNYYWALGVFVLTYFAIRVGHASYQDLGRQDNAGEVTGDGDRDEWYGKWLSWFGLPNGVHDFIGLILSGVLIVLAGVIGVFFVFGPIPALVLLGAGALKAVAYFISSELDKIGILQEHITTSEILTGILIWGALTSVWLG